MSRRLGRAMRLSVLLLVPLLALPAHGLAVEVSEPVAVNALAVAETPQGLRGTTARIEASVLEGSGGVFVDTKPLSQTDMQGSARLAARVAAETVGVEQQHWDFLVAFRSQSPVVGGPSAGAVMALAMATALWQLEHPDAGWSVDPGVAATGTINPDGTIGPVGGVPAKADGAAAAGLHTVAYPAGQEVTRQGQETVAMDQHCAELRVRCVPVASLAELIEVATGQRLHRPDPPTPATADLPQLEDSVREQVQSLSSRMDETRQRVGGSADPAVQTALDAAQTQLAAAREDLKEGRYYLAATMAFRGLIQQRHADALMDLQAQTEAATVQARIEDCARAVDALDVPHSADDWTALGAVAAAQVRVTAAQQLRAQAQQTLDQAVRIDDWQAALLEASFCVERAQTVGWWASLPRLLPEGQPVEDAAASSLDAIDRARDMVSYALSVQGTAGDAPQFLEEALEHHDAQRFPAAMLQAVEAEAAASVSLQAAGEVSAAVLDEARNGASRAVARAREEGTEPVLSVGLIELSAQRDEAGALRDLWTARGMALLGPTGTPPAPTVTDVGGPTTTVQVTLALVSGLLVGAMAMLVVWAAVGRRSS